MPDTPLLANRYRVGELLGTGGTTELRRGTDTLLARDVAIRFFRHGQNPTDARRVDDEIRALARLSHPGLVAVFDADPSAEVPYAVLERVEGRTLRGRITAGPMGAGDVRRLGAALADALAHVHAHGFVHHGVKPSNVLLCDDDAPRLADLGFASLAPAQVPGGELAGAADVRALGLVLVECLTGRPHRRPQVPDDLPFDLKRLLAAMISPFAAQRPTALECARALPMVTPPTLVTPLPRRSRGSFLSATA